MFMQYVFSLLRCKIRELYHRLIKNNVIGCRVVVGCRWLRPILHLGHDENEQPSLTIQLC